MALSIQILLSIDRVDLAKKELKKMQVKTKTSTLIMQRVLQRLSDVLLLGTFRVFLCRTVTMTPS